MTVWNKQQKQVIDSRNYNKNILVSAAAGSGKTAVLVERILESIMTEEDGEYKNNIDEFLVVTFTRAAASQMKEKITKTISEKINEESKKEYPDLKLVDHLLRQQTAVGRADICTLDSFSAKIVRENFNVIGIDPAFNVTDGNMASIIQEDITEEFFEQLFGGTDGKYIKSADFCELANVFFRKTSDSELKDIFSRVIRVASTMPDPVKWLMDSRLTGEIDEMPWMKFIIRDIYGQVETAVRYNDKVLEIAEEKQDSKLIEKARLDREILEGIKEACDPENGGGYKTISEALSGYKFKPKSKDEPEAYTYFRSKYSLKSGIIGSIAENITGSGKLPNMDSLKKEIEENTSKWIDIIVFTSIEIYERLMAEKHRRRQYEFSDISHFALQILSECDDEGRILRDEKGTALPSGVAKNYADKYKFIYTDEYQDSSYIQEDMLNLIARTKNGIPYNIFMVGDVKQSIYRFRQASPKLFIDKYNDYANVTDLSKDDIPEDASGVVIDLCTNYRSRKPVLDATNYIFKHLMQKDIGGIDYDDRAALSFASEADIYPAETGPGRKPLVMLITQPQDEEEGMSGEIKEEEIDNDEYEAELVASKIDELLNDEEFLILDTDKKVRRRVKPSDIAIIMRGVKGRGDKYETALKRRGIGVKLDNPNGYFDAIEITTMLSLLSVIDNVRQDIPLAAVLSSSIGGFTNSELMLIRGNVEEKCSFYDACISYIEKHDEDEIKTKLERFFTMIRELEECKNYTGIDSLIEKVLEKTGYDIYISALPNGNIRIANINMLMKKAEEFEKNSFNGLFNFLRYIEKCRYHDIDFAEAQMDTGSDDKVQITTIHKSKGLEYPVVFLVGLGRQFNQMDEKKDVYVDGDNHIAVNYLDPKRRIKDKSFMCRSIIRLSKLAKVEEEQRLLYVGMTRAREYLIMTGVDKKLSEESGLDYKLRSTFKKYLTWIEPLLNINAVYDVFDVETYLFSDIAVTNEVRKFKEKADYIKLSEKLKEKSQERDVQEKKDAVEKVYRQKEEYPYLTDTVTKAKMSVSEIKKMLYEETEENEEAVASYFDVYGIPGDEDDEAVGSPGESAGKTDEAAGKTDEAAGKTDEDAGKTDGTAGKPDREELIKKAEIEKAATRRGTVIHKIFELMDFQKIDSEDDMRDAAENIMSDDFFTEDDRKMIAEGNYIKYIARFANTDLFKCMKKADKEGKLYKEAPFTMGISSDENDSGLVIVQGIIDAYYIDEDNNAVIVDYKTDRTGKKEILIKRYFEQLRLYSEAVMGISGNKIKKAVIYSLYAGEVSVIQGYDR